MRPRLPGVIIAATIGNVLEWFDFLVYGFFAVTIAEVFFPIGNQTVSLLITFGAFGLAYVVRPLGAVVVGSYTDRSGRKAGLTLSIGLMMIGTILMVVTPGYATIGIAAPIIITIARLLQGFSVGGEFGSAVAFLVEHGRRAQGLSRELAMGQHRHHLGHRLAVRRRPDDAARRTSSWSTGAGGCPTCSASWSARPASTSARAWPRRRVSRSRKAATVPIGDLLRRHPVPVLLALGASIISNSSYYLLALHPDLRGQDPAPAGLYRLCRDARRRRHSRHLLGRRRALVGQDRPRRASC